MLAIKIMSPRLAATSPARKRFMREARPSAAIRHENVVDIHAIAEQPIRFLVMEHVAGETLQPPASKTICGFANIGGLAGLRHILEDGHNRSWGSAP